MTDHHEPSYYEIALTNRQVLVAFVVLLLCLLGAFFSGVWVGRGAAPDKPPAQAATPPKNDAPLEEYTFFSENGKRTSQQPAASAKPAATQPQPAEAAKPPAQMATPPGTTLQSDLGAKAAAPAPAGPESMGEAGEPPLPPVDSEAAASPGDAKAPAVAPDAKGPAPAAPQAAAPQPAPTTLAPNEMVVQVFSSPDLAQAHSIVERLKKNGYKNAFLSPVQVGSQTMQRVRIGPYTDRARAQRVADDVKKKFRLDTWITR